MTPHPPAAGPRPNAPAYDTIGIDYTANRRPEPSWAELITHHLGDARRVVNVGAGTDSYEPDPTQAAGTAVIAIEPSAVMVAQRPPGAAPVVRASTSSLPLLSASLDAAMAVLTIHHWDDWRAGLDELRRVARRQIILTIDFDVHASF
jgi:SAM-dependent methyltransferase